MNLKLLVLVFTTITPFRPFSGIDTAPSAPALA